GDPHHLVVDVFDGWPFVGVGFVGDLTDDLFQDVLDGDEPGRTSVLVHSDDHVVTGDLHVLQQAVEAFGVGHEIGGGHQLPDLTGGAVLGDGRPHEVLEVHHTDDLVHRLTDHGNAGEAGPHGQSKRLPHGLVLLDPHDLGARHHHLTRHRVPELEHRMDHLALVGAHDTAFLREIDEFPKLRLARERTFPKPST